MKKWASSGIELILTTGGTGLGSRDFTTDLVEELFDSRLPGVEQALHNYGYKKSEICDAFKIIGWSDGENNYNLFARQPKRSKRCIECFNSINFSFVPYASG